MPNKKKQELVPLNQTFLVEIQPEEVTLPIDTAAELTKDILWINELLNEVVNERYVTEVEDSKGNYHPVTKFHPLTMKLFEEKRKRVDQIWKILGGETQNEIKKEIGKFTAKAIFEVSKSSNDKKNYKDEAIKIIEAEIHESDNS